MAAELMSQSNLTLMLPDHAFVLNIYYRFDLVMTDLLCGPTVCTVEDSQKL